MSLIKPETQALIRERVIGEVGDPGPMLAWVESLDLTRPEVYAGAQSALDLLGKALKAVKGMESEYTAPLHEQKKAYHAEFKLYRDGIEAAKKCLAQRMGARDLEVKRLQQTALAAIQAAADLGQPIPHEAVEIAHQAQPEVGGHSRVYFDAELAPGKTLRDVPERYLQINMSEVKIDAQAMGRAFAHYTGGAFVVTERMQRVPNGRA